MVNEKDTGVIKTWQNLLDAHCNVELSNERVTSNNSIGYQFDVESITGHSSLVSLLATKKNNYTSGTALLI